MFCTVNAGLPTKSPPDVPPTPSARTKPRPSYSSSLSYSSYPPSARADSCMRASVPPTPSQKTSVLRRRETSPQNRGNCLRRHLDFFTTNGARSFLLFVVFRYRFDAFFECRLGAGTAVDHLEQTVAYYQYFP